MDLGLKNRSALVLGGGGGLGSASARALAREGVRVAVADIDRDALAVTVQRIGSEGGEALALEWDLAQLTSIDDRVSAVERHFGPVDVLVNITGGPAPSPASGQPPGTWRTHFDAMVLSVIAITDRVLPSMRTRKWGRIITSTSSGVVAPIPHLGISNALRMSLAGWSKTLAREVGRDNVTANVLVPGRIATRRIVALDDARAQRENRTIEQVQAGAVRDVAGVIGTTLPVWCAGVAAPPSIAGLTFVAWQEPIGCGGIAVFPQDVIVVDDDGAVAIPAAMVEQVVDAAQEQEKLEQWIMEEVRNGASLPGLYPINEENRARYRRSRNGPTGEPRLPAGSVAR